MPVSPDRAIMAAAPKMMDPGLIVQPRAKGSRGRLQLSAYAYTSRFNWARASRNSSCTQTHVHVRSNIKERVESHASVERASSKRRTTTEQSAYRL